LVAALAIVSLAVVERECSPQPRAARLCRFADAGPESLSLARPPSGHPVRHPRAAQPASARLYAATARVLRRRHERSRRPARPPSGGRTAAAAAEPRHRAVRSGGPAATAALRRLEALTGLSYEQGAAQSAAKQSTSRLPAKQGRMLVTLSSALSISCIPVTDLPGSFPALYALPFPPPQP
jgi:hypothetical protein